MNFDPRSGRDPDREREAVSLTRFLVHKHYCENDILADESLFDEPFLWFGTAEQEFAVGRREVLDIFRTFRGQVPRCNISDEEYHAAMVSPDVCLVAGRMWISTDPSTDLYIRVHQRITTCVRWVEGKARCCHIHISNPYVEMERDDVGFPTNMARQSREYLHRQLEEQKKLVAAANAELSSIYHSVPCGILRLRRRGGKYQLLTFNRTLAEQLEVPEEKIRDLDWSDGFSPFVFPEDIPLLRDALARLCRPGDRNGVDYRIRTDSGRVVHVTCSNDLISEEEDGQIIQRLTYDISQRVEIENALRRLSFTDSLTGLFNRNRFIVDVARQERGRVRCLGLACFDLNGLKEWNDRYGHIAGDRLLCRTAQCLAAVFPRNAYRMGGDEFIIMVRNVDQARFRSMVASVRAGLEREGISAAVGVSWRETGCDAWAQCDEADRLMYQEKQGFYQRRE